MKVVVLALNQPNFGILNKAIQILTQKYGLLSILVVTDSSPKRGGI